MGILKLFEKIKLSGRNREKTMKRFERDKAKYQWESSAREYCQQFNKTTEKLENADCNAIEEYAANHIAFFLVWVIQNGFYIADVSKDASAVVNAVKNEKMTGTEFLLQYCDGVLSREDLSPEIHGFADFYYDPDYLNDYASFVEDSLQKTVLGISFSWEEYHRFQHIIDRAYKMYLKR